MQSGYSMLQTTCCCKTAQHPRARSLIRLKYQKNAPEASVANKAGCSSIGVPSAYVATVALMISDRVLLNKSSQSTTRVLPARLRTVFGLRPCRSAVSQQVLKSCDWLWARWHSYVVLVQLNQFPGCLQHIFCYMHV